MCKAEAQVKAAPVPASPVRGAGYAALFHRHRATRFRSQRQGPSHMLLDAVFFLIRAGLDLLWWAVLLAAIVQTLMSFNVLDGRNRVVWTIADFLYRVTEPMLRPVRNRLPQLGGIDLSPLVVLLLITAVSIAVSATRGYMLQSGLYF